MVSNRHSSLVPQLNVADQSVLARDLARAQADADERFRALPFAFVERWLPKRSAVVTVNSDRPRLKFGELAIVDTTDADGDELLLYLPLAKPDDAGRRIQFVKKYMGDAVRLIPAADSLVNMFASWGGMSEAGLHEVWWDGTTWWAKEPTARVRRHGLEYQPLGLWQFNLSNGLADFSGHGRTMTVEAGAANYCWMAPGGITGLWLNGATTIIYDVADENLQLLGDMTFEMLVMVETPADNAVFFSHGASGETEAANILYQVNYTTAPTVQWASESGAGVNATATLTTPFLRPYQLSHVAVVRASNVVTLYQNGVAGTSSAELTAPTGGTSGRLRIGGNAGAADAGGAFVSAAITSAKLIARALSAGEVAAEYNRTMGPAYGFIDSRRVA